MPNNWLVVISEDNFQIALENELIGVSERWRKPLEVMQEGDNIVFYISKKKVGKGGPHSCVSEFRGLAEVTGPLFLDKERIWHSKGDEIFSCRRKIRFVSADAKVKVSDISGSLEFIKNPDYWMLYFLTVIRKISDADYKIIKKALVK